MRPGFDGKGQLTSPNRAGYYGTLLANWELSGSDVVEEVVYRLLLCEIARGAQDDDDGVVLELHGGADNVPVSLESVG